MPVFILAAIAINLALHPERPVAIGIVIGSIILGLIFTRLGYGCGCRNRDNYCRKNSSQNAGDKESAA